jgi:hypothetical protein
MGPMIGVSVSRSRVRGDVYLRAKKTCFWLDMVMSFVILFSTLIFVKISHIL